VNGYIWLLTDRYPFSGPSLEQLPPESAPLPAPLPEPA
jgi:hypothetical protein